MNPILEIEVDGDHNECLYFAPLQRRIRGRFDMLRAREPQAKIKATEWPSIPAQRIGIDQNGVGYIAEPLHEAEHSELRKKIELLPARLEPARQEFADAHEPTWLHWLAAAVRSGLAKVTAGSMPKRIEGTPQTSFIVHQRPSTEDRLIQALERQSDALEKLLTKLASKS